MALDSHLPRNSLWLREVKAGTQAGNLENETEAGDTEEW